MAVFSATAKKRTLSRQATIFRPATATGRGRQGDPWYPPPCSLAVHAGRVIPMVHTARTLETTKVIGRRWSRWSIGTIGVRLHPRFGPDAPRNPHHAVAQGVRVQGPPGRRGKSTKLRVSDTLSFWRFLGQQKKTGVNESSPGQVHGHKLLVRKKATSLQSLS